MSARSTTLPTLDSNRLLGAGCFGCRVRHVQSLINLQPDFFFVDGKKSPNPRNVKTKNSGGSLYGELGGKKKPKTIKTCYLSFEKDTLGRSDLINTLFINYIHPISLKEQSKQEELQSPLAPTSGGRPPPPLGFFTT